MYKEINLIFIMMTKTLLHMNQRGEGSTRIRKRFSMWNRFGKAVISRKEEVEQSVTRNMKTSIDVSVW